MLRTERGGELDASARRQGVERMCQVLRDRSRMRKQGNAPAFKRRAQAGFGDESIDTEFHDRDTGDNSCAKQSEWWKSALPGGCANAQYEVRPLVSSITAESPTRHRESEGKP